MLSTASAVLTAVQPEALQSTLTASLTITAGGASLWPTIQESASTKPKRTRGKWHYVWVNRSGIGRGSMR